MATTTIQVTDDVLELLKQARDEERAPSYNAILKKMFMKQHRHSIAGILGKNVLTKKEIRSLRDKDD